MGMTVEVLWPVVIWGTRKKENPTNSWWKACVLEIWCNGIENCGRIEYHESFGHPRTICVVRFLEGKLVDYGSPSRDDSVQMPSMNLKWRIANASNPTEDVQLASASRKTTRGARHTAAAESSLLAQKIAAMSRQLDDVQSLLREHTDQWAVIADCESSRVSTDVAQVPLMRNLAQLYEKGCQPNSEEASVRYKRCALAEDITSGLQLGKKYRDADGSERDYEQAVALFRRAAASGSLEAKVHLGNMYENGHEVQQDLKRAYALFKSCCNVAIVSGGSGWRTSSRQNEYCNHVRDWTRRGDGRGACNTVVRRGNYGRRYLGKE